MFTVQQVLHHPGKQSLLAPVDTVCGAGAPTALRAEALTVPRARASLELALPEFPRLARSSIPAWARAPRHLPTPGNSRGFRLAPAVNPQLRHAVRHLGHGPPRHHSSKPLRQPARPSTFQPFQPSHLSHPSTSQSPQPSAALRLLLHSPATFNCCAPNIPLLHSITPCSQVNRREYVSPNALRKASS